MLTKQVLRIAAVGIVLWMVFIAPPTTLVALFNSISLASAWLASVIALPIPIVLLISVFRSKSATWRWWVFQYLGISAVGFSASLCAVLLSLLMDPVIAGWIGLFLWLLFFVYGLYAAHRLNIIPISIASSKIKSPKRLVQISDIHVGSRNPAFLTKVINKVKQLEPDALLITGDLLDENVSPAALEPLSNLGFPAYYCSGNHERYVDYQRALDNIANHGVVVLDDKRLSIGDIAVFGISDRQHLKDAQQALDRLFKDNQAHTDPFQILLYHQPNLWDYAKSQGIDLTLSGHTHKGQIWPFGLLVRIQYKHVAGLYSDAQRYLNVSQGTGTWGPTLRFGTRCEITALELKPD